MAGADTEELGWDLSLRAQSRRALSMNSIWLREDEEGKGIRRWGENRSDESGHREGSSKARGGKIIDPILGFSIEGGVQSTDWRKSKYGSSLINMVMEHDLEDETLMGEEGKKRNRGRWKIFLVM
ncbi:hypothetical protein GOBAR_DD25916 [Gossypium barbadense]|nr:hypothetical protein GOBAR_DD25916 [Gossypium barbadense]